VPYRTFSGARSWEANLLGTAAFAHRVDQLDAIGVDDPEHGWGGQEDLDPVLMSLQKTKEPRPLGEAGKQRPIIARQPAVERTVTHAFARMQDPQGHDLAGPQGGVGMFGEACQRVIDLTE